MKELLYTVILLHGSGGPVFPTGLIPTLTRAECIERMRVTRMFRPEVRVICRTNDGSDVIDSADELKPLNSWSE